MSRARDSEKTPPKLGKVNDLQQRLYAKKSKIKPYQRMGLHYSAEGADAHTSWKRPEESKPIDLIEKKRTTKEMTLFSKLLILSVLFFGFSATAAYFIFTYSKNEVSFDAVDVSVLGPNTVKAGEELEFDVRVANNNPVDVVLSDVIVQYPAGTITATAESAPMSKDSKPIDRLTSGFNESLKFKSILFGAEGDTRDIKIRYQYRVPNSNQIFFKEHLYSINIESAPVVLEVTHPRSFESGDEVTLEVDVISNASKRVQNLLLVVDYPFGFEYASSSVPFLGDEGSFVIGVISPGERKTYTITGILTGQPEQSRTFRYSLGVQQPDRKEQIGSIYTQTESTVAIERDPVTLALSVGGNTDSLQVIDAGREYRTFIQYANNQPETLIDGSISLLFRDDTVRENRIQPNNGFYDSNTKTIRWSRNDYGPLAQIDSSDTGSVSFDFETLSSREMAGRLTDPELRIVASLRGSNFTSDRDDREVGSEVTKRFKIRTEIGMSTELLYSVGPIENTGPLVPVAEEKTSYSIYWKAFNTTSDVRDMTARVVLPPYIEYNGTVFPENASISYDERTRTVTWRPGDVAAGAGYDKDGQEVYFGVDFTPSTSQIGSVPTIMPQPTVTAFDTYTDSNLSVTAEELKNELRTDPDANDIFDYRVRSAQ